MTKGEKEKGSSSLLPSPLLADDRPPPFLPRRAYPRSASPSDPAVAPDQNLPRFGVLGTDPCSPGLPERFVGPDQDHPGRRPQRGLRPECRTPTPPVPLSSASVAISDSLGSKHGTDGRLLPAKPPMARHRWSPSTSKPASKPAFMVAFTSHGRSSTPLGLPSTNAPGLPRLSSRPRSPDLQAGEEPPRPLGSLRRSRPKVSFSLKENRTLERGSLDPDFISPFHCSSSSPVLRPSEFRVPASPLPLGPVTNGAGSGPLPLGPVTKQRR